MSETLVTPELEAQQGIWGNERLSPPVSESDIRRWAIATYWPDQPPPVYWDENYASQTRWGSIIAPPDFNPFAWPVTRASAPRPSAQQSNGRRTTNLNGGQTDTYGVPMRPGDIVSSRSRLKNWEERQGRMGLTLFVYTETEWRNQKDELVRRRISTSVRY